MLDDLHVVTIVTEPLFYFDHLHQSCRDHGINLDVIRSSENPHSNKWNLLHDYLDNMQNTDIVCYVDGFDTICVRHLYELRTQFVATQQKHQCKLIVSHHKKLHRDYSWLSCCEEKCQNTLISHGLSIGYVGDWKQVLTTIIDYNTNDHSALVKYGNLYPYDISIDVRSQFFLCLSKPLHEIDEYIDIDSQKTVMYEEEHPFFIHGTKCTYLTAILRKLGYNVHENMHSDLILKYYADMCKDISGCKIMAFYMLCFVLMYVTYIEMQRIDRA